MSAPISWRCRDQCHAAWGAFAPGRNHQLSAVRGNQLVASSRRAVRRMRGWREEYFADGTCCACKRLKREARIAAQMQQNKGGRVETAGPNAYLEIRDDISVRTFKCPVVICPVLCGWISRRRRTGNGTNERRRRSGLPRELDHHFCNAGDVAGGNGLLRRVSATLVGTKCGARSCKK